MESKLEPLDFTEEVKQYEAFSESKEVKLEKCPHKNTQIIDGKLKCKNCGVGWMDSPSNLLKLQKLLLDR